MTPAGATKPAQADCQLCKRLFCYFLVTKRRLYCNACVEIERKSANVFFNGVRARRNRELANA